MSATPPTAPPGPLGHFILVRMLASGKRKPTRSELDKSLKRYFASRLSLSDSEWSALLDRTLTELVEADLLERKNAGAYRDTATGRTTALAFLGVEGVGPQTGWMTLRNRYLVAKALGVSPQDTAAWNELAQVDGCRAAVLQREYRLPISIAPKLSVARTALAWKLLFEAGASDVRTARDFSAERVIRSSLLDGRKGDAVRLLVAKLVGQRTSARGALQDAIITRWLVEQDQARVSVTAERDELADDRRDDTSGSPLSAASRTDATVSPLLSLPEFARLVLRLARESSTGRFGDNKVYVSHVWNRFNADLPHANVSREEFNRRLVDANRQQLLTLSRADHIEGESAQDLAESEIRLPHGGSTFHLIRTDRE